MKIRKGLFSDREEIKEAHHKSILEICSRDYKKEVVEAWANIPYDKDRFKKCLATEHYEVVEIDGVIEGFCHANLPKEQTGEIQGLYLSPKAIGKGIGVKLVEQAMAYFKKNKVSKVIIMGTRTAKSFYERMGFKQAGNSCFHETRGVKIECYPMELNLSLIHI